MLCARFVPHKLMFKQWEDRVTSCRNFLQVHENNTEFFNKIITGDESWCFAYNLESKCQCETWVGPQLPKARKLRFEKSHIKTMLVFFFFHSRGLIRKEFVPTGQTVNTDFNKDVLNCLIKRINLIRLDLRMSSDLFLQHNNALAHNTASVRQFLAKKKKNVTVLHRLPIHRIGLRPIISYSQN